MTENPTPAEDYLDTASAGWASLFRRLTWHHRVNWNAPDYVEATDFADGTDGRATTTDLAEVEAVSSMFAQNPDPWANIAGDDFDKHALLIDLDVPAWLIPSSTEGHGHFYAELPGGIPTDDLFEFLDAAAKIGLVEEGYVGACKSRGMTSLRAPWIRKGDEPHRDEDTL